MFISTNSTPFPAEAFSSIDKACIKSCVVVVRATFDVDHNGECRISENQTPLVYADQHYDDPETTSVEVESDFAPIKPRAEIILNALAIAPEEQPVQSIEVRLIGPGISKSAIVTGDRYWTNTELGIRVSATQPFRRKPLAWHLAFGGTDDTFEDKTHSSSNAQNPVGRGYQANEATLAINGRPLPNIEHPLTRVSKWSDRPRAIGFGPVPRFSSERAIYAGTYDDHWVDHVLPFLPEDFDDRYFLSAPVDQQLAELKEDMEFVCINMSSNGKFRVRVPQFKLPIQFNYDDKMRVLNLTPDTLILEPHESRAVLVGRVRTRLHRQFTRLKHISVGALAPSTRMTMPTGETSNAK